MRTAVLTVSTSVSRREAEDESGPVLAALAEEFGEPYARLAVLLNEVRGWAKGTLPTYQDRKAFFEEIVNGDPDPIALLRAGDEAAVRDLIAAAQRSHTPAAA